MQIFIVINIELQNQRFIKKESKKRSECERRRYNYTHHIPERRRGDDRRSINGIDETSCVPEETIKADHP
jgi:hypothetical protein